MDDAGLLEQINALVHEEHTLREQAQAGQIGSADEHQRLQELEVQLDQCWDLLRQRRARREFGGSEAEIESAHVRPASEVEGYRQ
jgi:hypothetical protein